MGGRITEGNANIRGGKLNLNDDCKTMLEVGDNSRILSKSPKFNSVVNVWRGKSEKTILICEHSTIQRNIYTNNEIVSAKDNPLKLPTSPNYPGWTKNGNFGGKSNPGDWVSRYCLLSFTNFYHRDKKYICIMNKRFTLLLRPKSKDL